LLFLASLLTALLKLLNTLLQFRSAAFCVSSFFRKLGNALAGRFLLLFRLFFLTLFALSFVLRRAFLVFRFSLCRALGFFLCCTFLRLVS